MNTANHSTPRTSTSELPLTLWTATPFGTFLKLLEYHQNLLTSSTTLYSPTHGVVTVNGTISEALSMSSGVRQGCILAANLFNIATDRILNNTTQALTLGVNYDHFGQLITDLDYDDIVIFADLLDTLKDDLFMFTQQSHKLGLHVNWSNTKLLSFSPQMPTPPSTLIGTQPVTTTDNFTYLGSNIASNNSSFNDVNRCIATSTMSKLSSIWTFISTVPCPKDSPLQLTRNLDNHLQLSLMYTYQSPEETPRCLQHKSPPPNCVCVCWYDYVTNASILTRTRQPPLTTTICKIRLSAFGHICRLQPGTQAIDILASTPPSSWRRPRGRPPLRWADQIVNDTQMSLSDAVTATHDRTSWRSLDRS